MRRSLHGHANRAAALGLALLFAAGCGGDTGLEVQHPGPGLKVRGVVELPNGELAARSSFWRWVASSIVRRAQALITDNLAPAGPNVSVRLYRIEPANVVDGEIEETPVLSEGFTNGSGRYEVVLPSETDENTCRFLVQVGSRGDGTQTRAFVYGTNGSIDINVESEAVVRLILGAIADGRAGLCDFSADEIADIYDAVHRSDAVATGESVEELNASGAAAAAADPAVQAAIDAAIGPIPPTATATNTAVVASPTPTRTPTPQPVVTVTRTPSRTVTGGPTATSTNTTIRTATRTAGRPSRTVGNTATATPTATPTGEVTLTSTPTDTPTIGEGTSTATPTDTPTQTQTETPTTTPTSTPTQTPTPSTMSTATATSSSSNTPAASPTPTLTPPVNTATATRTVTPTATRTSTFTATATSTPLGGGVQVNVGLFGGTAGVLAGTAGGILDVPVSLVTNGASISAVSNDLVYDGVVLDVQTVQGDPNCAIDAGLAGSKQIVARVTALTGTMKRLRVGLFGADNQDALGDGNLYHCRFVIALDAAGTTTLDNQAHASSPQGAAVDAAGVDGNVTIGGGGPVLGLGAGSAAAGGMVDVTASLAANGAQLSAISTDIRFDSTRLEVVGGADPDCTVDESIGGTSLFDKEVFASVLDAEEPNIQILRVGVVSRQNNEVLPDIGTPLPVFRCRFQLGAEGGDVVLQHSAHASDPSGLAVGIGSLPGTISVE